MASNTANRIIMYVSGAALLSMMAFAMGVRHERAVNEAKVNKTIVKEIPKVAAKEAATNKAIEGVGNETESKVAALTGRLDAANAELGRLRVKRSCTNANPAPAASARDAASNATEPTNGPTAGEVNLDGVAGKIIELGGDLDAANIRIDELRGLVVVYQKACKVD